MGHTPEEELQMLLDGDLHPSVRHMLPQFRYSHLPDHLSRVSAHFCRLAVTIGGNAKTPEATVALRKLREAKDCAVLDAVLGSKE